MSDKQESLWSQLSKLIPGYGAYRDQESRREDDRLTRDLLIQRLDEGRRRIDRMAASAVESGDLNGPAQLEPIRSRIDLARSRVAAAVEGYAGVFNSRSVDAKLLEQVAEHDADLVSLVDQINATLDVPGGDIGKLDMDAALELLERLRSRIDRRAELLKSGV